MKYILGSGITGLLAKTILGADWTVIPFYKSRFYSYSPPLCDNFIIADPQIDHIFSQLGYPIFATGYKRVFSVGGQLVNTDNGLSEAWLQKLFRGQPPSQAIPYMAARNIFFVYEQIRINKLYAQLLQMHHTHLRDQVALGLPSAIQDGYILRGNLRQEYSHIVSTIPLPQLLRLLGRPTRGLQYKPLHYIHMQTQHLNFEGASQVLVVDPIFSFYKVSTLARDRYLFYCHEDIQNPGQYFLPIIADYDLLDGTMIPDALPLGEMPDLTFLDPYNVFPVGAYAQHDYCADVGSNILRLLRYAERNFAYKNSLITIAS